MAYFVLVHNLQDAMQQPSQGVNPLSGAWPAKKKWASAEATWPHTTGLGTRKYIWKSNIEFKIQKGI